MSTLATFCGRHGDILWALPTVRALSEARGYPIDFVIGGEFAGLLPILRQQSYFGKVYAAESWGLSSPEPWKVPQDWVEEHPEIDEVFDLGYRGWPPLDLARTAEANLFQQWPEAGLGPFRGIDLERPWIQIEGPAAPTEIAVGFTEAWFELKVGLVITAIEPLDIPYLVLTPRGSRWTTEARYTSRYSCDWLEAAGVIRNSDLFVGDCSALHVLAVALGKKVILAEPMEGRWNPVFYPKGTTGPVQLVLGNDNNPTFDARALKAAIEVVYGL